MTDLDPASPARRHAGWRPTNAAFYARLDVVRERRAPPYRPQWLREEQRRAEEERQAKAQVADKLSADDCTQLVRLRADIAWMRFELAMLRFRRQETLQARGYNPNQPRVPAGNPDGGQWTSDAGLSTDISAARRHGSRPHGHHFVPHSLYSKEALPVETRKVFDEAKTGRLYSERHLNSPEHVRYNEAVDSQWRQFLAERSIEPSEMTPDQAREFVRRIRTSSDLRIREFNLRIYQQELKYWMRRGPRRSE